MRNPKRLLTILSYLVLILAALSLFGHIAASNKTRHASKGDIRYILREFIDFPAVVMQTFQSSVVTGVLAPTTKRDPDFVEFNNLQNDVYGVTGTFNSQSDSWDIKLLNFKDLSTIHSWAIGAEFFLDQNRQFANSAPRNPIVLPNRDLIVYFAKTNLLLRVDSSSNVVWENRDLFYHHSANLALDGNIWICTREKRRILSKGFPKYDATIRDDHLSKLDVNTGKLIYDKSIVDIFNENGYRYLNYGFAGHEMWPVAGTNNDPQHLNDIEPALFDSEFFEVDDLFLSIRQISAIVHYRPSTNEIIDVIQGPFLNQHDVDIVNDSTLSIFNNNISMIGNPIGKDKREAGAMVHDTLDYSNITIYNLRHKTFSFPLNHHFESAQIKTMSQGFHQILNNGDVYVENQNHGQLFFMNEEEILAQIQFVTDNPDYVHLPNWIRIYETLPF